MTFPLSRRGALLAATGLCCFALGRPLLHAQGSLTPSAGPAPTMKSLDQIEARTPVQTLTGDSAYQFVISASGAYYLTGNITGLSGRGGILVDANNVTIDLNGFTLSGVSGALVGISANASYNNNFTVRNGIIANWPGGGISMPNSTLAVVETVTFNGCAAGAVHLGQTALIRRCQVENSGSSTSAAVTAESNAIITDCMVHGYLRTDGDGIQVDYGSLVESCVCSEHGGSGIVANGSSIRIHNCNCFGNSVDGIRGNNYIDIVDCTCSYNGTAANASTSADIHIPSSNGLNAHIDRCFCTSGKGRGIAVDSASGGAVVTRNSATNNAGGNYAIATGNRAALIVTYNAGTGYTSGDPLANTQ